MNNIVKPSNNLLTYPKEPTFFGKDSLDLIFVTTD